MRTAILALLSVIATPALAADWQSVDVAASGEAFAIDMQSIRRSGDNAEVWMRIDRGTASARTPRSIAQHLKFDCTAHTAFEGARLVYDDRDALIEQSNPLEARYRYHAVAPDTVGAKIFDRVCG